MTGRQIIARLKRLGKPENVEGMARYGISSKGTLGVPMPAVRALAKEIGRDHRLAGELWKSGIHEARILATLVEEPDRVTERQMERWARDFDSWDVVDQCCMNLFRKTALAYAKALEWSRRDEEFVKRAGFALMATLAVHDKSAPDSKFTKFLTATRRGADDERNFVKKAVSWALRQIGKRNQALNAKAVETAERIALMDSKSARWIASDALRELTSAKVRTALREKAATRDKTEPR